MIEILKQFFGFFDTLVKKWGLSGALMAAYCTVISVVIYHMDRRVDRLNDQVKNCQKEQVELLKEVVMQNTAAMKEVQEEIRYQKIFSATR